MKIAALLRLFVMLLAVGAADLISAKTDPSASGPAPVLFKREARFSRLYNPAIKPDREATPLKLAPLVYPPKWEQWGQSAYAVMAFLVDETGRPVEIQCTEATDRAFAKAAAKALEFSRFMPALKNQQGVCSKVVQRVDFTLPASTEGSEALVGPASSAVLAVPSQP